MTEVAALGPPGSVETRRASVVALGTAIRELGERFVGTEVSEEVLAAALVAVREVTASLAAAQRGVGEVSSAEDLGRRIRVFNPVTGAASPLAPPLRPDPSQDDGYRCVARVELGLAHEGPFTYAHGGVTAALLDDVLGRVASSLAQPVVTSSLSLRYRGPVPLRVPLLVVGTTEEACGRRVRLRGSVATAAAPDEPLVEAEGWFVVLSDEQAVELFGSAELHGVARPGDAACALDRGVR